jgi:polyhydroxyalkanoate synthesis repressor PhaR
MRQLLHCSNDWVEGFSPDLSSGSMIESIATATSQLQNSGCTAAQRVQNIRAIPDGGAKWQAGRKADRMKRGVVVAAGESDKGGAGKAHGASREKSEKIVIKKYANRRLYNTAKSSYVTLDDLSKMVRAGKDFSVYDAKTGEDITRSVLAQIIFEEEAKGQSMLPTNFLRQIIGLYGDALQGVVPSYLEASMETFAQNQEKMREAFGANPAIMNFEALARSNMEWFEQAMRMFSPFGAAAAATAAAAAGRTTGRQDEPAKRSGATPSEAPPEGKPQGEKPAADLSQDLNQLQRQLSEMQAQLERLTRSKG